MISSSVFPSAGMSSRSRLRAVPSASVNVSTGTEKRKIFPAMAVTRGSRRVTCGGLGAGCGKKTRKKRHHQKRFEGTDRSNTWIDIDRKNPFNLRLDSILTRSALNSLKMVASLITQQKRIRTMPREIHLKPWHYFKGSRRKRGGGFGWEINES